jgi:hypothetical protein
MGRAPTDDNCLPKSGNNSQIQRMMQLLSCCKNSEELGIKKEINCSGEKLSGQLSTCLNSWGII